MNQDNQDNQIALVQKHLSRGGSLCKEFNRVRLSDDLDWRIEQGYALEQINKNFQLQNCDPSTIGRSMIDLAFMGLSLSPALKEAYLIPYKRECTASPSYMGLINILARTGVLAPPYVETEVVREGDKWREWADPIHGRMFEHEFAQKRGKVTNVWAVFTMSNGTKKVVTMDENAINGCRNAAAKKNGGDVPFVWKGAFREEMYKKSCIRRGWKTLPKIKDPRVIAMLEAMDRTDPVEFDNKVVPVNEYQNVLIGQDELEELHTLMREAGMPNENQAPLVNGLASTFGVKGIRKLPMASFEDLKALLQEGLEKWKAKLSKLEPSDSKQVSSTAQTEAA